MKATNSKLEKSPIVIIIVFGTMISMLSFGMRSTLGLFMSPVSETYGWGREVFAFSIALQNLIWGIMSPFSGYFAQRLGNVKTLMLGALLYSAGLILTAYSDTPWMLNIFNGLFVGVGVSATSFGIVLPTMARMVSKSKRALVLGIGTAGGSAGQFVIVMLSRYWIADFGWQNALVYMGLLVLLILVLAVPLSKGDSGKGLDETEEEHISVREVLQHALGSSSYRYVLIGFFVCGFHLAFISAHLPSFLMDSGFGLDVASLSIGLIGFFNIIGSYYAGVLSAKYKRKNLLFLIYFFRTLTIAGFMIIPLSVPVIYTFSILSGLLWLATIPPTSGLVEHFFGTRHMAMLYGLVFLNHQLGSFVGVWLGGYVFDTTGNYDLVWYIAMVIAFLSSLIHLKVVEKPVYSKLL